MNTETLNALKQVNLSIQELQNLLHDATIQPEEVGAIEDALLELEAIQDTLIHQTLQVMIDQLNSSNAKLQEVLDRMEATTARLEKLAKTLRKVADVVGTLADITKKALGAGLLK